MGLGRVGPLKGVLQVKKKTLIIIVAIIAVAAIFSAGAYAWWTLQNATIPGNEITTGQMGLTAGGSVPISAADLIPQARPPAGPDGSSAGYTTNYFYVTNTGDTPLMFYGFLGNVTDPGIGNVVWAKITVAPTDSPWGDPTGTLSAAGGPYISYEGPINALYGEVGGKQFLSSRYWAGGMWNPTPLAAGQQAWYKVVLWLDGQTCDDFSQDKTITCDLTFKGTQPENWVD
jgi:hypothetical protein